MWKVVYIAPNVRIAEQMREQLAAEGLLVAQRALQGDDNPNSSVEIMVPQSEAEEAHELISCMLCEVNRVRRRVKLRERKQ